MGMKSNVLILRIEVVWRSINFDIIPIHTTINTLNRTKAISTIRLTMYAYYNSAIHDCQNINEIGH